MTEPFSHDGDELPISPLDAAFPVHAEYLTAVGETETIPETGEVKTLEVAADAAMKGGYTREDVVTHIANLLLRRQAELAALKAKHKPILDMVESEESFVEKQIERCEAALRYVMPPLSGHEAVTNKEVDVFYMERIATEVENADAVPIEFCEVKTTTIVKALKAKEALLAGEEVPGVRLKRNYHLQVKKGGARAIANAKTRNAKRRERLAEKAAAGTLGV